MTKFVRAINIPHMLRFLLIFIISSLILACAPLPHSDGLWAPEQMHAYSNPDDIWDVLGDHFHLRNETPKHHEVSNQISWYATHPMYIKTVTEQSRPYLFYIFRQIRKRHMPAELTLLPIIESTYNPFAYSKAGASGLWQMMPGTASGFGLKVDWWYDGRRDIIASTNAALNYLEYLGRFFNGDWLLAVAAYDTGEGTVKAAIKHNKKLDKPTDFWNLPLPLETKVYIPKLLALATIIKYPNDYPVDLPAIPYAPYLAKASIESQIDLSRAAKLANISLQELSKLNPGFNRWATDPDGPNYLLLPIDKINNFNKNLAKIPKARRVTWKRYKVKSGDNLINIAHKYKTSVHLLIGVNNLKGNLIHINQTLLIPLAISKLTTIVHKSQQHFFSNNHNLPEIHLTYHAVKKGESLKKIGWKYHVTPQQLRFWNGLKYHQHLKTGRRLIIWPPHHNYHSRHYLRNYKIRQGDTLSLIAKDHHSTSATLRRINHLHNDLIRTGQIIKIPITHYSNTTKKINPLVKTNSNIIKKYYGSRKNLYHVKSGDTLSTIAKHYNVSIQDIKRWNCLADVNQLKLHQPLVIYQ